MPIELLFTFTFTTDGIICGVCHIMDKRMMFGYKYKKDATYHFQLENYVAYVRVLCTDIGEELFLKMVTQYVEKNESALERGLQ